MTDKLTAKTEGSATFEGPTPEEQAHDLFGIYEELAVLGQALGEVMSSVGVAHSEGKAEVQYLVEWGRRHDENVRKLRSQVETLGAALDRIKIVALNTGLEGARLGDLAGKVLVSVADELRQLTSRGLELLLEQASRVEQLEQDGQLLLEAASRSQQHQVTVSRALETVDALEGKGRASLQRFSSVLEQSTGIDLEGRRRVNEATLQARTLVSLLTTFAKPNQQRLARAALLSELGPLLRFLATDDTTSP